MTRESSHIQVINIPTSAIDGMGLTRDNFTVMARLSVTMNLATEYMSQLTPEQYKRLFDIIDEHLKCSVDLTFELTDDIEILVQKAKDEGPVSTNAID